MKTTHLFENGIYWIQNFGVNNNSLFKSEKDLFHFERRLEFYLSEICEIIHQKCFSDQFHLIIRIKTRTEIIQFYKRKYANKVKNDFFIPPTTYIVSQQLSNLQNSYAKKHNRRHQRAGTLFSGRFKRTLIENLENLSKIIIDIKAQAGKAFKNRTQDIGDEGDKRGSNEKNDGQIDGIINMLRGCFQSLPPKSLFPKSHLNFIINHKKQHLSKPNFN